MYPSLPNQCRFLVSLSTLALCLHAPAAAQRMCTCDFADKKWEGYGSKYACSTTTTKGRTSCNVSFGGTGADPAPVNDVIGQSPDAYQREVHRTLVAYLKILDGGNTQELSSPDFLAKTILPFVRGAYLRTGLDIEEVRRLDKAVIELTAKHSKQISDIFRGLSATVPVPIAVGEFTFAIGRGTIEVSTKSISLTLVFLPAS